MRFSELKVNRGIFTRRVGPYPGVMRYKKISMTRAIWAGFGQIPPNITKGELLSHKDETFDIPLGEAVEKVSGI